MIAYFLIAAIFAGAFIFLLNDARRPIGFREFGIILIASFAWPMALVFVLEFAFKEMGVVKELFDPESNPADDKKP
jgi:hypothetical protein